MKKMSIVVTFVCLQLAMFSQSMGKGKNVFYLGVGVGEGYSKSSKFKGYGYTYRSMPTFHLGFEHGISEAIPQSIIGLGAHASIWSSSQTYRDVAGYGWDKHWMDVNALFRGLYHHKFLVGERWDVYAALMAGIKYRAYTFSRNDPFNNYTYADTKDAGVFPAVGAAIGGRYYVSDKFGFYAELSEGYNINTFAQIGLAFKI